MYSVIVCYHCGRLLLAEAKNKTRQCPHCGARLVVAKTKQVASVKSAQEASQIIRSMKQKRMVSL